MSEMERDPMNGSCIISEEVIATIACAAATEVKGVAGMAQRPVDLRGLMASQALKSVRVQNTEDETILDIYIHLLADVRIPDVVPEVQRSVKVAVQSMTGKPVTKVNVHVMGVTLPEESADRA